jgi:streptogramin lyase
MLAFIRGVLVALFVGLTCPGLSAQTLWEFTLPADARPESIVSGPDGNLWFTDGNQARIGRLTTAGLVTLFSGNARPFHSPNDLAAGPDGNLWLVQLESVGGEGAINRVTLSGGVTEFIWTGANRITAGPDGNLWFTDFFRDIGRIAPAGPAGQVTYFDAPQTAETNDITAGPDGNLWFTYYGTPRVGRATPSGDITEIEIPFPAWRITSGPDGNLWFTTDRDRIVRMTTAGASTAFEIPGGAGDLIAAPDGNIWFTYGGSNRLGRIRTDGTVLADITIPDVSSGLTIGPDGNVWFTEPRAGRIGRVELTRAPAIASRILPVVGSTIGAINSFFRTAVQIHNATTAPMSGRVVFHPSGASGAESDPAVGYVLQPGQTQSIADLLPAMGRSGVGSADIEVTVGGVPITNVRVFNDWGAAGTTGFTEEPMRTDDALRAGGSAVLILPEDLTRYRFNLGVRTLSAGARASLTLRDASGAILATVSRTFPAAYHEQQPATAFLGVAVLPAGRSISIAMTDGAAIFYGATVDNTTGDPSLQIARVAP